MPTAQYQDPQLAELAQLAQVAALLQEPQHQQQSLDQQERIAKMTAAIHLMGLQQQREYQQGELAHGQAALDAAMKEREMTAKTNVTDALVSHLSSRPDVPIETISGMLENSGHPELGAALTKSHQAEVAKTVATLLPQVEVFQKTNNTKELTALMDSIKGRPELVAALQPHLQPTVAAPEVPLGTKLGSTARNIVNLNDVAGFPGLPAYFGMKTAENVKKKYPTIGADFWNALLGKPQPAQ